MNVGEGIWSIIGIISLVTHRLLLFNHHCIFHWTVINNGADNLINLHNTYQLASGKLGSRFCAWMKQCWEQVFQECRVHGNNSRSNLSELNSLRAIVQGHSFHLVSLSYAVRSKAEFKRRHVRWLSWGVSHGVATNSGQNSCPSGWQDTCAGTGSRCKEIFFYIKLFNWFVLPTFGNP